MRKIRRKFRNIGINITPAGTWSFNLQGIKEPIDAMRQDDLEWTQYPTDNMAKYRPELSGHYILDLDNMEKARELLPPELWYKAMNTFRYNTTSPNKMHCLFKRSDEVLHKRVIWSNGAFDSLPSGIIFTAHLLKHKDSKFKLYSDVVQSISSEEITSIEKLIPKAEGVSSSGWEIAPYPADTLIGSLGVTIGDIALKGMAAPDSRCNCPFGADHTNGGEGYGFVTSDGTGVGCNSCHKIMVLENGGSLEGDTLTVDREEIKKIAKEVIVDVISDTFEMKDTYEECIAEAATLRKQHLVEDAVKLIKSEFGYSVGVIRADIIKEVRESNPNDVKINYPDYYFTQQGELKYYDTVNNLKKLFKDMKLKPYYDVVLKDVIVKGTRWNGDNWQSTMRGDVYSEARITGLPQSIDALYNTFMMSKERNPLIQTINRIKWDGKDHVSMLANTIKVSGDDKYKKEGLTRWLIQCVAAWDAAEKSPRSDKVAKYELILVMQSKQGVKKTSFFGRLLPGKLAKYFGDGASLHTKDKDSVMNVLGYGIVELGELDSTFKKSDISDIKSFTSKRVDKIRPPYGKDLMTRPRRTSFCGSVNDVQFLNDQTGARRFLVMAVKNFKGVDKIDMMQVWGQVWDMYIKGEKWWIENDEEWAKIRDIENEHHRETGLYGDMVIKLRDMLLSGHIIPTKITGSALFELVNNKAPNHGEAINFAKELLACKAHRNKARYFSGLKEWAKNYR